MGIVIGAEVFLCMTEPVFEAGQVRSQPWERNRTGTARQKAGSSRLSGQLRLEVFRALTDRSCLPGPVLGTGLGMVHYMIVHQGPTGRC